MTTLNVGNDVTLTTSFDPSGWGRLYKEGQKTWYDPKTGNYPTTIPPIPDNIEPIDPDEDLRRRQREHLERVRRNNRTRAVDCLHNACPECLGTGVKHNGAPCIHNLACPCGRCTPTLIS